jgi:hypothetical protein
VQRRRVSEGIDGDASGSTNLEDDALALDNLVASVAALGHEDEFVDAGENEQLVSSAPRRFRQTRISPRCHDLLVLGRDEHGRDADELELDETNDAVREKAVDDVDGDPERLGEHVVAHVHL